MLDRSVETGKTISRRGAVRTGAVLSGAALATGAPTAFVEKIASINIINPATADQSADRRQDSVDVLLNEGDSAGIYQGIQVQQDPKFEFQTDVEYRYNEQELQEQSRNPNRSEAIVYENEDGEEVSTYGFRRFVSGPYFSTRSAQAAPIFVPTPYYPDNDSDWVPLFPWETAHDRNRPELHAVGQTAHKADVLMADSKVGYGEYIKRYGSLSGLYGSKGDAPIRAHMEYIWRHNDEVVKGHAARSVQGYCYQRSKEAVNVRPKLLKEYLYIPKPSGDPDRTVLRTFTLADGSQVHLTVTDARRLMAIIGSCDTMLYVPQSAALSLANRGKGMIAGVANRSWGKGVAGVSSDNKSILVRDWGNPDKVYPLGSVNDLLAERANAAHFEGRAIVGGEMSNKQIVERGSSLIRSAFPRFFYSLIWNLPKPPIEEFLEWRDRLRGPDVRMVYGGF